MAKKQSRKELLKQDDAFLSAARDGAQWARDNRTAVIAGTVALVVLITAVWGGAEFFRARNLDASRLLDRALDLADAEVITVDEETKADPTGDPPTFASDKDKNEAVLAKLREVVDATGSEGVGTLARFYIGDRYEHMEQYEDAEKTFAQLVHDLPTSDSLYFLAVERTAYLQERRGDTAGALATLERLSSGEGSFYRDYAFYHQARIQREQGNVDEARSLLERVEKDFPDSPLKQDVESILEQIGRKDKPEESAAAQPGAAGDSANPADPGTQATKTAEAVAP